MLNKERKKSAEIWKNRTKFERSKSTKYEKFIENKNRPKLEKTNRTTTERTQIGPNWEKKKYVHVPENIIVLRLKKKSVKTKTSKTVQY